MGGGGGETEDGTIYTYIYIYVYVCGIITVYLAIWAAYFDSKPLKCDVSLQVSDERRRIGAPRLVSTSQGYLHMATRHKSQVGGCNPPHFWQVVGMVHGFGFATLLTVLLSRFTVALMLILCCFFSHCLGG